MVNHMMTLYPFHCMHAQFDLGKRLRAFSIFLKQMFLFSRIVPVLRDQNHRHQVFRQFLNRTAEYGRTLHEKVKFWIKNQFYWIKLKS